MSGALGSHRGEGDPAIAEMAPLMISGSWVRRGVAPRQARRSWRIPDANPQAEMRTVDLIWLGERLADIGRLEMRAQQPGVPTAEFVVMRHVVQGPPSTITSLARRTGYAQSRVSTAVRDGLNAENGALDRLLDHHSPARRQLIYKALDELLDVLREETVTHRTSSPR